MSQRKISSYSSKDEYEHPSTRKAERMRDSFHDFCERYPKHAGLFLRQKERRIILKEKRIDELQKYKILLGEEEKYNFDDFLRQSALGSDEMLPLRRTSHFKPKASFIFSARRDAYGSLQSDHCFLSGQTGMGKTNLCALLTLGFPRRPNPTVILWAAQKTSTASMDFPKIRDMLLERGYKATIVHVGKKDEENEVGKLPINELHPDDVRKWFGMSNQLYQRFMSHYMAWKSRPGGGIADALREFVLNDNQGQRFQPMYLDALEGDIFAFKKRDEFKIQKNQVILLDISHLLRRESRESADVVTAGWCNYIYNYIAQRRADSADLLADTEYYKRQWQGMIIFDEFYELSNEYNFDRTLKAVSKIGIQGRQEGTSIVIATQTVFGSSKGKVTMSQAQHVFQFKPSSMADQNFVLRNMGWEKSEYDYLLREIFSGIFPPTRNKDKYKGRILLFSKDSGSINAAQLHLVQ